MDIEELLLNNNIISQIEKDNEISPLHQIIDTKEKQRQDMIDILQNLFKIKFESKLSTLEKNSQNHFTVLKNTLTNTKYITDLSIKIQKQIDERKMKDKRKNFSKISKSTKKINFTQNKLTKISVSHSKTPIRTKTSRGIYKSINVTKRNNNSLLNRMKKDSKNKALGYNIKISNNNLDDEDKSSKSPFSYRSIQKSSISKEKSLNNSPRKNFMHKKNISTNVKRKKSNIGMEDLSRRSVLSNETSNIYLHTENSKSSLLPISKKKRNSILNKKEKNNNIFKIHNRKSPKKNSGLIGKMKKNLDKSSRSSPFKRRSILKIDKKDENINKDYSNENEYKNSSNIDMHKKDSMSEYNNKISNFDINSKSSIETIGNEKILSLENNLQKQQKLIDNDPLLISPLKDLYFVPKELGNNILKDEINYFSFSPKEEEKQEKIIKCECSFFRDNSVFDDEYLNNILIFLSNRDIFELKNCSKSFHKLVVEYLIKMFDTERNNFIEKQNGLNLSVEEIPQKLSLKNLTFSKGALKAIKLLNEEILNRIFLQENIPNKEIFIVYKIYFQLIKNQELIKYFNDSGDTIFWKKCRNYFLGLNGKTGDCLNDIVSKKKLFIDSENIYKIYKLVQNDIDKITPTYFSKICGTTGLFVFFIKDILDFLGFSNDKNLQKNAYWSYSEIINSLDSKINILNKYQKY